uniref:Putative ABC-type branched-chain amino acid transport system n=1 Tax=Magnetococcus massalia (strain MO-1) TaxID=451514 RepID=A0A1S7LEW2_MAGMO|nr:Putative ABC-type branched-chain amino acid transport system [Candidatus Magnetococcus massalia]
MKRLAGLFALAALIIALPLLFPDNYYVTGVGPLIAFHAIAAVGLNLLIGYAGQISLGHAAFLGIGAYSSGLLTTNMGWNPWLAMLMGALLSLLVAFAIARPILKLKGHYLAMATLGFGIIINILMVQPVEITGGPDGLSSIPALSFFGWEVDSDLKWYGVSMAALLLAIWIALNLISSRMGHALRAVHGSEVGAAMMGVDAAAIKTRVFVISALYASVAGSLFAHQQAFISPESFGFHFSIELVVMVVLGGMASTYGAVFGALVLTMLPELLVVFEEYEVLILGAIMMGLMIFLPRGVWVSSCDLLKGLLSSRHPQRETR